MKIGATTLFVISKDVYFTDSSFFSHSLKIHAIRDNINANIRELRLNPIISIKFNSSSNNRLIKQLEYFYLKYLEYFHNISDILLDFKEII